MGLRSPLGALLEAASPGEGSACECQETKDASAPLRLLLASGGGACRKGGFRFVGCRLKVTGSGLLCWGIGSSEFQV